MFLLVLSRAYDEETITKMMEATDTRVVMRIPETCAEQTSYSTLG